MILRLQCSFQRDTTFPRDALVINPHFKVSGDIISGVDAQALTDDLAAALNTWDSGTGQLTVKAYDAESPPPNYPLASTVLNAGVAPPTSIPREMAVCLSYYAGQNRPRRRGRLYIPACLGGIATSSARIPLTSRQKVAELVPIFADLGGLDCDWTVWSRVGQEDNAVTNWWVDDAWDVIRSRGLQPSVRLEGTTGA